MTTEAGTSRIGDGVEIEEVLARYSYAIDQDDERAFSAVFTADAVIDFTRSPFPRESSPSEFWAATRPTAATDRLSWQHVVRNPLVLVDGDGARAYSELSATGLDRDPATGVVQQLEIGGLYVDDLVRTPEGWRIARRTLHYKSKELRPVELSEERAAWIDAGRAARDTDWLWALPAPTASAAEPATDRVARLADETAVRALLSRYAHGIDQRWWGVFHSAFAPDAIIDGSDIGLGEVTPAELQGILSGDANALRLSGQHLVSNVALRIDGDSAVSVAEFVTHTVRRTSATDDTLIRARQGGTYVDEYRRIDGRWGIARHTIRFKSNESATVDYDRALVAIIDDSRRELLGAEPAILESAPVAGANTGAAVDRRAIADVLVRYSQALDQEWWHLLDGVFTGDAVLHGENVGLGLIGIPQFRALLPGLYATRLSGVHSLGPSTVWLAGDTARSSTEFTTVSVTDADPAGTAHRTRSAGTYFDELVRTAEGWRIAHRHVTFKASLSEVLPLDSEWQDRIAGAATTLRTLDPLA